jgi:hypothetical protein
VCECVSESETQASQLAALTNNRWLRSARTCKLNPHAWLVFRCASVPVRANAENAREVSSALVSFAVLLALFGFSHSSDI